MISIQQWRSSIGSFEFESRGKFEFSGPLICGIDKKQMGSLHGALLLFAIPLVEIALVVVAFCSTVFRKPHGRPPDGDKLLKLRDEKKGRKHKAVIETLLVIGGVETNPGPIPVDVFENIIDDDTTKSDNYGGYMRMDEEMQTQEHTNSLSQQLNPNCNMSSDALASQSRSNSGSPSSTTSSNCSPLRAIYRLKFGAVPVNNNPNEKKKSKAWTCSQQCKKKNEHQHQHFFSDSQALEKHIMRCHPDPIYNKFVCIWCDKKASSPQQILDHLGQAVKSGGHAIIGQREKNEMVRAVHKDTGKQFRIKRAKNEFAWYICVPLYPSPRDSRSPSPIETVSSIQDNQIDSQASPFQVDSSNQSQPTLCGSQNQPSGRPPDVDNGRPLDVDNGRPPDHDFPDLLMSGGFSRVQVDSPTQSQAAVFERQNKPTGRPPDVDTRRPPDYDFPDRLMTDSFSAVPG